MMVLVPVSLALLSCFGAGHRAAGVEGAAAPAADRAMAAPTVPAGVAVRTLPEGLLVERVSPGGGAEAAGVRVGDLVVTVDDIEVRKAPRAALDALAGPVGSRVELVVRRAEGGDFEAVEVTRRPLPGPTTASLPEPVANLRRALTRRGPGAARRAARAAVAAGFGGLDPAEAVGGGLAAAWRRRPAVALAAADVLAEAVGADPRLDRQLASLYLAAGRWDRAATLYARLESARPPDVWEPTGDWRGEAGGGRSVREGLARSLWARGDRDAAIAQVRALLASHDDPELAAIVGMAPWRRAEAWRASLPPIDDVELPLLDGGRFVLSEHRGEVVVLTFFATWCGPCREELPALSRLAARRGDAGVRVIAVSLDDERDAASLPEYVRRLGLDLPVAHAPQLGRRFGIDGIPALRVIDRHGALVYEGSGYSTAGMDALERLLDGLSADAGSTVLGPAWAVEEARLAGFLALPGTLDVVLTDRDLALSRRDGPPVALAGDGTATPPDVDGPGGGDRVTWLSGPVTAASGQRWVRATTTGGRSRWLLTTAAPVTALDADGDTVWIGTEAGVLAVDSVGRVRWRLDGPVTGLATDGAGGAWVVDGAMRRHVDADGRVVEAVAAPGAALVDGGGRVASGDFTDLLRGRFGPEGGWRSAVARDDGTLVVLDGRGQPAMTWALPDPPRLAAGDLDGDGQDELLVAVRDKGLATVRLSVP